MATDSERGGRGAENGESTRYPTHSLAWGNNLSSAAIPESLAVSNMPTDSSISDDPGTILDTWDRVPNAATGANQPHDVPAARPASPRVKEVLYSSTYRWAAPRIVICDEGSLEEGETFYVRSERVAIGRAKGDIVIGHDVAMSGSHAEIVRRDAGGKHSWVLQDLGSSNGTFARVRTVTLQPGLVIHLGSRRYRFDVPVAVQPVATQPDQLPTMLVVDLASLSADVLPALVESAPAAGAPPHRHAFRSTRVTVGRPECGNAIEIDDLCLAANHAVITRDVTGAWQLEARPSLNGVWVKVDSVTLTDNCLFQCGEQRFRFRS